MKMLSDDDLDLACITDEGLAAAWDLFGVATTASSARREEVER